MKTRAILKNVGMSPKKVRIPVQVVKGMGVVEALSTLKFMQKGAAQHVAKVIKSAAANAQNKEGTNPQDLFISEIKVDKGVARIRHYHPRAKGGGYYMWIRGKSHITVVLEDRVDAKNKKTKKNKVEENKADVDVISDAEVVEKKPVAKKKATEKKPSAKAKKQAKAE